MRKEYFRAGILLVLQLLLYNAVAFLILFVRNEVYWISYGFTMAAHVVAAVGYYIAFLRKPDAKSVFYGFPISRISGIYAAIQFVLGILFMSLGERVPVWLVVLVQGGALCVALTGLIYGKATMDEIIRLDEKLQQSVSLMRKLQSRIKQIESLCEDPETLKAIRGFSEELRYSDPVSSEALEEAEANLSAVVEEISAAVCEGDYAATKTLCARARVILGERNQLCKLNK